jgi:hypothetical protein
MTHNGPAVCFSKRNPTHSGRTSNLVLSRKSVPVGKGGFGAVFGIQVQSFIEAGRVAVQCLSEPQIYPRLQSWLGALAQCRGTSLIGARRLSRCRILITSRCACPGT